MATSTISRMGPRFRSETLHESWRRCWFPREGHASGAGAWGRDGEGWAFCVKDSKASLWQTLTGPIWSGGWNASAIEGRREKNGEKILFRGGGFRSAICRRIGRLGIYSPGAASLGSRKKNVEGIVRNDAGICHEKKHAGSTFRGKDNLHGAAWRRLFPPGEAAGNGRVELRWAAGRPPPKPVEIEVRLRAPLGREGAAF